jgi:hypothetical protein
VGRLGWRVGAVVVAQLLVSAGLILVPVASVRAASTGFQLYLPVPSGTAAIYASGPHPMCGNTISGAFCASPRNSVDLGPPDTGTNAPYINVRAAAAGVLHFHADTYNGKTWPNCWATIDHAGGWVTSYYHLTSAKTSLDNTTVHAGDVIAQDGQPYDGHTTGAYKTETCGAGTVRHLHFSLWQHVTTGGWNGLKQVPIDGTSFGGYTVHASPANGYACGYWTRDSDQQPVVDASTACDMEPKLVNNLVLPSSGKWYVVASPNPGSSSPEFRNLSSVVALSTTNAWAVGSYLDQTNGVQPLLAHWNGSAWSKTAVPTPDGNTGSLRWIGASGANVVFAFGSQGTTGFYFLHYDGTGWHEVNVSGIPSTASIWGMTVQSAQNVWLVGYDTADDKPLVLHWAGPGWTTYHPALPSGATGGQLSAVAGVPGSSDAMAVGYSFVGNASTEISYAVRWDGTAWSQVTTPTSPVAELRSVKMLSATSGWAVGTRYPTGSTYQPITEHWDGTAWTAVPSPHRSGDDNTLLGLAAASGSDLWAVGYSDPSSGAARTLTEHYDGSSWSIVSSPNPSTASTAVDELFSVAHVPSTTQFWAVGEKGPAGPGGDAESTLIEHYHT